MRPPTHTLPTCRHLYLRRLPSLLTSPSPSPSVATHPQPPSHGTPKPNPPNRPSPSPPPKNLAFFERNFVLQVHDAKGVLGIGGGHVGKGVDALEPVEHGVPKPDGVKVTTQTEFDAHTSPSSSTTTTTTTHPFWRPLPALTLHRRLTLYLALSKFRLASLVVLTAMAGYAMCPVDPSLSSLDVGFVADTLAGLPLGTSVGDLDGVGVNATPGAGSGVERVLNSLHLSTLLSTAAGTMLCISSANALNQLLESPYDAQMSRTRGRPLVRRLVTPLHTTVFAGITGVSGVGLLAACVNPLTAILGFSNIVLYAFVYTPMKRMSITNTWVGALVGAIPPLMGWAACSNSLDPMTQPGAWALFATVFFWQFPHFNSLAHNLRRDYSKAGYRMMAVTHPSLNARVSLRYALLMLPLCSYAIPAMGLTSWWFAVASLGPNGYMGWRAWRFWRFGGDGEARKLFWSSLVHLPVVLVLMMGFKKREGEAVEVEEVKRAEE